ncbi:hypothetical protein [Tessaracoccus massiliensis]|uniref:hypothetical protein n=1 Tax=Tessaracoccus massiliensis TaxID=1522311 RepID=UPI00058AC9A3|nr:hypothetical protein [Tessaracoccus massiliensis]
MDPEQLEAVAKDWNQLSSDMSAVTTTNVPTTFGLVPDLGVVSLSSSTTQWSTGAGGEYNSISGLLMDTANSYRQAEQANVQEAGKIG